MELRKYTKILDYMLGTFLFFGGSMAYGQSRTYTLDADFDEGTLVSVNHDAPNNNQLQLNTVQSTFPFVNVACSSRGTATRIDVNTCAVLGEYLTAPAGMARNPSRTTVDLLGNVWVANRDECSESPAGSGNFKGSVVRIGLVIGGMRVDAGGNPDPFGQYLSPPFQYSTCVDQDGDGLIRTSSGLSNILPWSNAGGADTHGGVSTADDECIINYTRVTGCGTRTLAVDPNNDVWVGGCSDQDHEKLNGVTALPIAGTQFNLGCGGYGGLIDGNGILWSTRCGGLARYDTVMGIGGCFPNDRGDYGLGIDPNTAHIWHSSLSSGGVHGPCCRLYEFDSAGNVLNSYGQPFGAQGVAVDGLSHVWMAEIFGANVWHLAPDPLNLGQHYSVGIVPGFGGSTGVAVDANGKIWVSEFNSSTASRIDPNAGPGPDANGNFVGAIDCTTNLGAGCNPYNYSDMTGFVAFGSTAPQGTWTVVFDTGSAGTAGCVISWNNEPQGAEPPGTSIAVEARAADNVVDLPAQAYVAVANGSDPGLVGRHVEIRAILARDPGVMDTPVLSDLAIVCNQPPDCSGTSASSSQLWPPNHQFVPITILGVTDPDGDPVAITIDSIFQDEPVLQSGGGAGNTSPDGTGVGTATANVRSERNGNPKTPGNGRVYHIDFTADDGNGGTCVGTATVCVPHDQRPGASCVDGGALYDSTTP